MRLSKELFAVRPGEIYPELIPAGEECPAELEASARAQGCLESIAVDKRKK